MKIQIILLLISLILGCQKKEEKFSAKDNAPQVNPDQRMITFPEGSLGLEKLKIQSIEFKEQFVSVIAPAHVVASIADVNSSNRRVVLESPVLNELYFNYAQSIEIRKTSEKKYQIIRDMTKQQAATAKDLREAERDWMNSKYSVNEADNKLRAKGIVPNLLDSFEHDTVLLVSDVAEIQLSEVQLGEEVDVVFNSYPQEKFVGKVINIGDVIDPISRTLKVTISVLNESKKFKAGMYAKVEFGDLGPSLLSVPVNAVFTVNGDSYVFKAQNERTFILEKINPILYGEKSIGIKEGLNLGDRVVSEGVLLLKAVFFGS